MDFTNVLGLLYDIAAMNVSGKVASYIPELEKVNPDLWGVSVCTIDGQRTHFGDTSVPFTLQSVSKPFNYACALEMLGIDFVHKYVGHEPTNDNFDAIIVDSLGRPHNPMVNSGAIMICALLQSEALQCLPESEKFSKNLNYLKTIACGEFVGFNNMVYISEKDNGSRNRAITHYLQGQGSFPPKCNLEKSLDLYFRVCSMEVTCSSLSVMAAVLAAGGMNIFTGKRIMKKSTVKCVLSLMQSCGMYNYSGEFAFLVGIPAKSGVSGGICMVIPGLMGIAIYSPRLNEYNCCARGLQFCKGLVKQYTIHPYDTLQLWTKKIEGKHFGSLDSCAMARYASEGDTTGLAMLIAAGYNIYNTDLFGRTALHMAAISGEKKCVRFLVDNCDFLINQVDKLENSALDDAIYFGKSDIVQLLESLLQIMVKEGGDKRKVKKKKIVPKEEVKLSFVTTEPLLALSKKRESSTASDYY